MPYADYLAAPSSGAHKTSGAAPGNATSDIAHTRHRTHQTLHNMIVPLQALHGDIAQSSRESILRNFRADKFSVLVATDVAARGLDIPSVELVVHYDLPDQVGHVVLCCGSAAKTWSDVKTC